MRATLLTALLVTAAVLGPAFAGDEAKPRAAAPSCRDCHGKAEVGDQWGRWSKGPHAKAYRSLSGPQAAEAAKRAGVEGDPAASAACLACHAPTTDREAGVTCQACHGADGSYSGVCAEDFAAAVRKGLHLPDEKDCRVCHRPSPAHPRTEFEFTLDAPEVAHRRPATDDDRRLFSTEGIYREWTTFTKKDGLPSDMVFGISVRGEADRGTEVWFATDGGVARLAGGTMTAFTVKDGLPHPAATQVAFHEPSGEVWVSTLGGIARFDGKAWTGFTQASTGEKGLINDCGFGIAVHGDDVWVATFDGIGRYDRTKKEWRRYYLDNAPLDEVWIYGLEANPRSVDFAVWGGGLVQYSPEEDTWEAHHDPDSSFEMNLIRDDGVISQMATATSTANGRTWVSSYFGGCAYDGRDWREWDMDNSGLRTNFVQGIRARRDQGWFCTNDGLLCCDLARDRWVDYRRLDGPGQCGEITIKSMDGKRRRAAVARTSIPWNFVWAAAFEGEDIWVGTSAGAARGRY